MKILFRKKYLFLLPIIFFALNGNNFYAEEADSLIVKDSESIKIDSIRITGNDKTQEFVILRELTFQPGDTVTGKILRFNKERVFSLALFNRVNFIIHNEQNKNILEIRLSESWYIYPIPFLRANNGDFAKATYGINLLYKNFRGRNENLRAMIGFGYDPTYSVLYNNPSLIFEDGIGLTFLASYTKFTNKSISAKKLTGEDFQYKIFSQSISISKRFNPFNTGFVSLGFNYLENPFALKGITASGGKNDRLLFGGVGYIYDSRDLKQFSENGLYTLLTYYHKGFGINNINYNEIELDFREYRTLFEQLSGKWRIEYRTTFGNKIPYYDYSYLGFYERVRGHYRDIREGNNFLLTSFEVSYPIVKEWNLSLKLPLLPEKLTSARIGIYLTGFVDAGNTFNNGKPISINQFYSGYGFGLTFLFLPYSAIRFEYALNELGRGEFIVGIGFSF
ncbi:MAG: POTRA domain-containing protein [Melioribacteraceae bacterium]